MKLSYKLWLSNDENEKFFGDGPCLLLKKIQRVGSLNKAAAEMHMAYSKAFRIIKAAEKNLGYKLLKSEIGGTGGGGSKLTLEAKELVDVYSAFEKEVAEAIEFLYQKIMISDEK